MAIYEQTTTKLLKAYSYKAPGTKTRQVDIVRDVANLVNARFAASLFSLPIKTEESPRGIYTEQELYQVLTICFICILSNADLTESFQIREAAHMLAQQLVNHLLVALYRDYIPESGSRTPVTIVDKSSLTPTHQTTSPLPSAAASSWT
jgi:hypothetical protein